MEAAEESLDASAETPDAPWSLILLAGGAGWLVVTVLALLWMYPMSGRMVGNVYYVSTGARAVQHLMVFGLSVLAYRVSFWRGTPTYRTRPLVFIAMQIVLALIVVRLAPFTTALAGGLVDHRYSDMHDTIKGWLPFVPSFWEWLLPLQFFMAPYLLGLAMIGMVQMARDYHRESLRSARLWAAYAETRLKMLSTQLQPHFLFNALHAVSELIHEDANRASIMLARLGDFLRHALESSQQPWVSVATEIAGLEAYLAVQQARFRDQLRVSITINPEAAALTIPSMLLQPLAENAIEHGRAGPSAALDVSVAAAVLGERLRFTIRNSTPQMTALLSPENYGNGLQNVQFRLRAAYGNDAQLRVGPDPAGGTLATLDVPARRAQ
jgi:hypothetical protein